MPHRPALIITSTTAPDSPGFFHQAFFQGDTARMSLDDKSVWKSSETTKLSDISPSVNTDVRDNISSKDKPSASTSTAKSSSLDNEYLQKENGDPEAEVRFLLSRFKSLSECLSPIDFNGRRDHQYEHFQPNSRAR